MVKCRDIEQAKVSSTAYVPQSAEPAHLPCKLSREFARLTTSLFMCSFTVDQSPMSNSTGLDNKGIGHEIIKRAEVDQWDFLECPPQKIRPHGNVPFNVDSDDEFMGDAQIEAAEKKARMTAITIFSAAETRLHDE